VIITRLLIFVSFFPMGPCGLSMCLSLRRQRTPLQQSRGAALKVLP
jgi:hypothetical protein